MSRYLIPKLWGDDNSRDIFSSLHNEIERVLDDFQRPGDWPLASITKQNGIMSPRINVSETDKLIEVSAELPGVEEKDIDISLMNDVLTLRGEKKSESEKTGKNYRLVERSYGSFERSVQLPCEVKTNNVNASFNNGVLLIKLPKSPAAKDKVKKIAVKAN